MILEEEGVTFNSDGCVRRSCMIERIETSEGATRESVGAVSKLPCIEENDITTEALEKAILDLVTKRGTSKSC